MFLREWRASNITAKQCTIIAIYLIQCPIIFIFIRPESSHNKISNALPLYRDSFPIDTQFSGQNCLSNGRNWPVKCSVAKCFFLMAKL